VIIAQHPQFSTFMTQLPEIDAVIAKIAPRQDNFKYIVIPHPHFLGVHHQKFMVAGASKSMVAFCGGLDISVNRAPQGKPSSWHLGFVWHDAVAKLEGLIAHDLEREFVAHWNRDRSKSTATALARWKGFEELTQRVPSAADKSADLNKHPVQMLRTVSVGPAPADIRRDDIWRAYFRLIGRATRFIYLENQYFYEPALADAIVKQAESQPGLIVMVTVGTGTDDIQAVDTTKPADEQLKQKVLVQITQNQFALRLEFFKRLSVAPLLPDRLRVYTLNYPDGITHTKLILVDDEPSRSDRPMPTPADSSSTPSSTSCSTTPSQRRPFVRRFGPITWASILPRSLRGAYRSSSTTGTARRMQTSACRRRRKKWSAKG
jgi:phosphatidylserine/phosphatidylglycerophosphate/cardiolipin synthase-like enzyme